jgi:hypothetical protein
VGGESRLYLAVNSGEASRMLYQQVSYLSSSFVMAPTCDLNLYGVQAPGERTLRALGREIEIKRGDLSERAIEKPQNLDETYKGCFQTH